MDCLLCHGEGGTWPVPTTHQGIPVETCLRCHQAVPVAGVPDIPHTLQERGDCLVCHAEGGVKPVPADHEGRTNESCLLCHEVAPVEEIPTATGPAIPHALEGRERCLVCHGEDKMKPVPPDHKGREEEACQICHLAS